MKSIEHVHFAEKMHSKYCFRKTFMNSSLFFLIIDNAYQYITFCYSNIFVHSYCDYFGAGKEVAKFDNTSFFRNNAVKRTLEVIMKQSNIKYTVTLRRRQKNFLVYNGSNNTIDYFLMS